MFICVNCSKESTYENVTAAGDGVTSLSNKAASWTDTIPDLNNLQSDPLIKSLLEPTVPDVSDVSNRTERSQNRQDSLFALYPAQSEVESCFICLTDLSMHPQNAQVNSC